jgi:hypothetical protein
MGMRAYVAAPRVQRPLTALMTASIWFLDGPLGAVTWTKARRRARSSSVDHWGAMVEVDGSVLSLVVGLVSVRNVAVLEVGGAWVILDSWCGEWKLVGGGRFDLSEDDSGGLWNVTREVISLVL